MPRLALIALLLPLLLAPALGAAAAPTSSADGAAGWSVAPAETAQGSARPNFDYQLAAGQSLDDAFSVRNDGATPLTLNVYAADAFTTREGTIDLLPAGDVSVDAGTWVTLEASEVTLQPGETGVIPFTVRVPESARPGDHPAGIVASLTSHDADAQVQVDRRLGSRMYIRVAGDLAPAIETSGVTAVFSGAWNPLAMGTLDVTYQLRNSGNTRITGLSSVGVSGPLGAASMSSEALTVPEVLPGSEITVTQTISGVGALLWLSGAVELQPASVGIGATQLEPVELDYQVAAVPFALLLVLLVAAAVVLGVIVLRRRRGAVH